MKVILNEDVKHLGEEGDVKEVAAGYARNYLFPRNLAVPCNKFTLAHFEGMREEIEARKAIKRKDAASLKERLEDTAIVIPMPAGPNGKLYGAVTTQTIVEELQKLGFEIERKKIDIQGNTIKTAGSFPIGIRLYENAVAEINITVEAQIAKTEAEKRAEKKQQRQRKAEAEDSAETSANETAETQSEVTEQVVESTGDVKTEQEEASTEATE